MVGRGQSRAGRAGSERGGPERGRGRSGDETAASVRARIMTAMLEACGEKGYRAVAVRDVIERYGGYRSQFYGHFASKADCYAAAYETEAERLYEALAAQAAGEGSWRERLERVLAGLGRFACERPALARGLLVEVQVARGRALEMHREVFERLTRAMDSARRETRSRHSPPPMTALFMVSAIESSVTSALLRSEPQSFAAAVPELAEIVASAYCGEEAGERRSSAA